jgi:predicted dehydrogenase
MLQISSILYPLSSKVEDAVTLTLGLFGCGVMGRRHILGLKKLRDAGRLRFDLAGVCDLIAGPGQQAADMAAELLGRRPQVFTGLDQMRRALGQLDAIAITTAPDAHVTLGVEALDSGAHVLVEKPIALTVRQGLRLVQAAEWAGRKLAVAENYRRDPINRLARALLDAGAVGRPFLAIQSSSGGGEHVIITPWRHLRQKCGIVVDMGVHYTDLLEYYLGPIEQVVGMSVVVDRERRDQSGTQHPADAEDLSVGVARFGSGALANWLLSLAGRGEDHFNRVIYGTGGALAIPPDRSGQSLRLTRRHDGADVPVVDAELLAQVPDFALDATTAALFGGERLAAYTMEWADVDANLLAIEYDDFAAAIVSDRQPEVAGADGLRALALVYGFLESERLGRAVGVDEMLGGTGLPYQDELEAMESQR